MTKKIISWDLGATKCTAGLIDYHQTTQQLVCKKYFTMKLAEAVSLEDLISKLELGLNFSFSESNAICIGAAGHYDGKYLIHENSYPFPMHFASTAQLQHWPPFTLIHDYSSIVCATFTSYMEQKDNIKLLNTSPMKENGRRVALGIGTGLGLKDGVLFPNGDFWLGQNEMGHIGITMPPSGDQIHLDRHKELMRFLNKKFAIGTNQPITYEKILTGKGLVNLYEFFHPATVTLTPEEIGSKMQKGKLLEIKNAFAWYIGLFIGTVQLTFMPEGGIWMTGGVVMNHLDIFDLPDFFSGIYASPSYLMQREEYPLGVLCREEHALIGSAYYAVKRLLG